MHRGLRTDASRVEIGGKTRRKDSHSFRMVQTAAHFPPSPPRGRTVGDVGVKNATKQLLLVHFVLVLVLSAAVLVLATAGNKLNKSAAKKFRVSSRGKRNMRSVFGFQFSVFSFQFSVFSFQFSVFGFRFSSTSTSTRWRNRVKPAECRVSLRRNVRPGISTTPASGGCEPSEMSALLMFNSTCCSRWAYAAPLAI